MCSLLSRRGEFLWDLWDRLGEGPAAGPGKRWFFGVVLAAAPVGIGVLTLYYAMAYSKAADWFAFALAILSAGTALHFYYFWASRPSSRSFGIAATRVSLLVLVASIAYLMVTGLF